MRAAKTIWQRKGLGVGLGAAILVVGMGCGAAPEPPAKVSKSPAGKAAGAHADWWCTEHGVPEEVCALCDTRLVADFKAKGDWCEKHDRPDSQCFSCHPEHERKFAAMYEAKYGKKPPERTETESAPAEKPGSAS